MDFAYEAPDWQRPEEQVNLKEAAENPWMGLTAILRDEPWLVIGYDGVNYTLENTNGDTVQLNTPFEWYPGTEEEQLLAASRLISREAKLVYDEGWKLATIPAAEKEILWIIDDQGEVHFNESAHNHYDLASQVTASDELNWRGYIHDEVIVLSKGGSGADNSEIAKHVYEAAKEAGLDVKPQYKVAHDVGERKDEKNDPLVCPDCGSHTVQLTERAFAGDQSEFHCKACGKIFHHKVYFNPHAHVEKKIAQADFKFSRYALGYEIDDEGDYHHYAPGPDDAKKKECPNCGGYKWKEHHKGELVCDHCKSSYPLEEIIHHERGTMSSYKPTGPIPRCQMCGEPDIKLGQNCPTCGKSQTIWRYDKDPSQPIAFGQKAPAANKWAKEAFTKDQNGNPLQVGKPYVMHSPKYKVPDVIRILKVEPNLVEAAIDGDDEAKFPLTIDENEYSKMMYSFEPFDPRPPKQADYGYNPTLDGDDRTVFQDDEFHHFLDPSMMDPGDPDKIIETPWPEKEPLTIPEEFPPLPEEVPVPEREPALPVGGNPPGNPQGHPPLTFPQEWLGQPDPAQAYPRNSDEMWNQGSTLWKEGLIDPAMDASDIMHQQHMHNEQSQMPMFDDQLDIYSVRGTLHLYQNSMNNAQYLVMADGEGGIMGWTPFTGQSMAGQVQQWNTNDLTRIEDAINQGTLMEVPMPALQGPGMGIQPGMMPQGPGIPPGMPPQQPGMEMPPPPGGAPPGPDMGGPDQGAPPMPPPPTSHVARKNYAPTEQKALIEENLKGRARNFDKLDLSGTHYEKKREISLHDVIDEIDSHLWMW